MCWSKPVKQPLVLFDFIWSLFIIPFVTDLCLSFELLPESFHYILSADPSAPTALVYCLTQYEPCDALELCGKLCHFHPENQLIT